MHQGLKFEPDNDGRAKIRVVGCGGAGGNAVNNMIQSALKNVTFIVANTDLQDLDNSLADNKIKIGEKLTRGLGAGADPDVGRNAAMESREAIRASLEGSDMVFITAGMGGGTGTGSAPIVAEIAKEVGALTVGVVTKPFFFEGERRIQQADEGARELAKVVDSIITIPNDRLLQHAGTKRTFSDMLKTADQVLYYAVKGIADLVTVHGLINLDFADIQSAMATSGTALMGTGIASGEGRAKEAANRAISSALLADVSIAGAKGVLINITCAPDMLIDEVAEAADIIYKTAGSDAEIFFGTVFDEDAGDEMRITVIATGIKDPNEMAVQKSKAQSQREMFQGLRNKSVTKAPVATELTDLEQPAYERKTAGTDMSQDRNIPAFVRKQRGDLVTRGGDMPLPSLSQRFTSAPVSPGEDEFIFDSEDDDDNLGAPTFMRKTAN